MSEQCKETVYIRDTYRYTGRGRNGFTMHYRRQQCSRPRIEQSEYCWQHDPEKANARWRARMHRRVRTATPGTGDEGD